MGDRSDRAAALAEIVRTAIADASQVARGRVYTDLIVARAVRRLATVIEDGRDDLSAAERWRQENAAARAEMEALGNGRTAPMIVARRRTSNPREQQSLARRFRRIKNGQRPFRGEKSE